MARNLKPDQCDLAAHFNDLFRYASDGVFIAHRIYAEGQKSRCISRKATRIGDGPLIDDAVSSATIAATHQERALYCPPLAGFSNANDATMAALVEAYTFTVDCDQYPLEALKRLVERLGPATLVLATGGEWENPDTGEVEQKVHAHWRLTEPATGDDLAKLKAIRGLAAERLGTDPSGVSPAHCFRAPGSWHRKGEPKLANITSHNPNVEIDLDDAVEQLEGLQYAPWVTSKVSPSGNEGVGAGNEQGLADLMAAIQTGASYHDPLVRLAARLVGSGTYHGAAVKNLRGHMDASAGPRDQRWHDRYNDIPRIVESATRKFGEQWPDPKPLPNTLPPVMPFDPEMLPPTLTGWVMDIAERMQCPADFVAVSVLIALGAVIGRRVGIRAQENTDWTEVPNLWGMVVGRPGVMKSPAMRHALIPLRRLDALAAEQNAALKAKYDLDTASYKPGDGPKPEKPSYKRFIVNDTSYEALGEVMADNPNGILVFRDELISLLKPLAREDQAAARGFYLTAWNGNEDYTFDRIGRGRVRVPSCCLSLLGATQPGKLASYLNDSISGGDGDDGFAQRFGVLVWPEVSHHWKDIDREPDVEARRSATRVFDQLAGFNPEKIRAQVDDHDPIPYLRFAPDALAEFRQWRADLEGRLRGPDLHDAMASHLNKYRGLVPSIALIMHLAEGGSGPVSLAALLRALVWAEYLETHAHRAYASVTSTKLAGARNLLTKIKGGHLPNPFTARDVYGKGWSGLGDHKIVGEALQVLADHDWLRETTLRTGGHPKTVYAINPKVAIK